MTKLRLPIILWCVVLFIPHAAAGYIRNYQLARLDDDRMWYYFTGLELGRYERSLQLQNVVRGSIDNQLDWRTVSYRVFQFDLRMGHSQHYLLPSVLYRLSGYVLKKTAFTDFKERYPRYLAHALFVGFGVLFVIGCIAAVALILSAKDMRLLVAFTLAVCLIGLIEVWWWFWWEFSGLKVVAGHDLVGPHGFGIRGILRGIRSTVINTATLMANPAQGLSLFGDNARNPLMLVAMGGVFAYRWRGWHTASYAILPALPFFHATTGGALLVFLVVCDMVLRPHVFARPRVWLPAGATAAAFVAFEGIMGRSVGISKLTVIAAAISAAVVGLLLWTNRHVRERASAVWNGLSPLRTFALSKGQEWADLLIIALLWCAILPITYVGTQFVSWEQQANFWTLVNGRALALFRPILFFAFSYWVVSTLPRVLRTSETKAFVAALMICSATVVPVVWQAVHIGRNPIPGLIRHIEEVDATVGSDVAWDQLGRKDEHIIYYALARTLETGEDRR